MQLQSVNYIQIQCTRTAQTLVSTLMSKLPFFLIVTSWLVNIIMCTIKTNHNELHQRCGGVVRVLYGDWKRREPDDRIYLPKIQVDKCIMKANGTTPLTFWTDRGSRCVGGDFRLDKLEMSCSMLCLCSVVWTEYELAFVFVVFLSGWVLLDLFSFRAAVWRIDCGCGLRSEKRPSASGEKLAD